MCFAGFAAVRSSLGSHEILVKLWRCLKNANGTPGEIPPGEEMTGSRLQFDTETALEGEKVGGWRGGGEEEGCRLPR